MILMITSSNGNIFHVIPLKQMDAGDLRRHRAHYDINVMFLVLLIFCVLQQLLCVENGCTISMA